MKMPYIALVLFIAVGCHDPGHDNVTEPATEIDGLEMTFIETNLTQPTTTLEFISETTGFTADYDGGIFKTTSSGEFWSQVSANASLPIMDIYFVDDMKGFAVGGSTQCSGNNCTIPGVLMLRTLDGGQTWSKVEITTQQPVQLVSIYFIDKQNGFAAGSLSILRTTDGGETWSETTVENPGATLMNVKFFDGNNGIVTGIFNKIIKTSNGGDTWEVIDQYSDFGAFALSLNGSRAFSSHDAQIHRSLDRGENWDPVHTFDLASIWSLNFISETTGFAFGSGQWSGGDWGHSVAAMYYTKDAGQSWIGTSNVHEIEAVIHASFPTPTVGYAIGYRSFVKVKLK